MTGDLEKLKELLASPRNIVITTHQKPDGDAMGSSLALFNYLKPLGHQVRVITPTEYPDYFDWMPGEDEVWNYLENPNLGNIAIAEAELIFCLDFNDLGRIEPMDGHILKSEAQIVLIDHHLNPKDFWQYKLHDTKASSTCELIYTFLHILDEKYVPTKEVATCIYTGILTDTASFSNGATNKKALQIVAELMDCGLELMQVQEELNQNNREERLRFVGNALNRKMVIREDIGLGYITVSRKDAYYYNLQTGDTEGLVNYPLTIKNIKVSVLIKQEGRLIKISMRSKGDFSVERICREYFEGGGHRNASGGKSYLSLEETIEKLVGIFEREKIA